MAIVSAALPTHQLLVSERAIPAIILEFSENQLRLFTACVDKTCGPPHCGNCRLKRCLYTKISKEQSELALALALASYYAIKSKLLLTSITETRNFCKKINLSPSLGFNQLFPTQGLRATIISANAKSKAVSMSNAYNGSSMTNASVASRIKLRWCRRSFGAII